MSKAKLGFLVGAAIVALSAQVQAADVCTGSGAAGSAASAGSFIINSFTVKCSNNVYLGYTETSSAVGVCSVSKKGNKKYGGTSEGGAVKEAAGDFVNSAAVPGSSATAGCS